MQTYIIHKWKATLNSIKDPAYAKAKACCMGASRLGVRTKPCLPLGSAGNVFPAHITHRTSLQASLLQQHEEMSSHSNKNREMSVRGRCAINN